MITLLGMLARHAGHRLESSRRYVTEPGHVYGSAHLYLSCLTCRLGLWDQDLRYSEGSEPEFPEFDYGWGDYAGRYAYSWHRSRDVAAIWYGSHYVSVTVSGAWQPGMSLADVDIYEVLNVRSGDTGELMIDFTPEALTKYFMESGQAG